MSDVVVDASVVLTWCFPDEHSAAAGNILGFLQTPGNRAVVPSFFHQEVLNALVTGQRRSRISRAQAQQFMADVLTLPFEPVTMTPHRIPFIEELCDKHKLTAYDATYLDIVLARKLPLASFDHDLRLGAQAEGVLLL